MRKGKQLLFVCLLFLLTTLQAVSVSADWGQNKKGTRVWYTDETGARVKGLAKIGSNTYCFDDSGLLRTGWVSVEGGYRYFDPEGKAGRKLGRMFRDGVYPIGKYQYGFGEDGVVLAGLSQIGRYWYYFRASSSLGVRGRMFTDRFVNLPDGRRSYFRENGRMAVKAWVRDKQYYLDASGDLLRSDVAPGGWLVNAKGRAVRQLRNEFFKLKGKTYFYNKKRTLKNKVFRYEGDYYYVDEEGIRRTGWVTWKGHTYYFGKKGKAAVGKTKIGGVIYKFNNKGQLDDADVKAGTKARTGRASVLVLCGHGQGDPGAAGYNKCGTFYEHKLTREFGEMIVDAVNAGGLVDAELFNTKYDMFQQLGAKLNSAGVLSSVTGKGSKKKKVLKALRTSSIIPNPTLYDYVLEVHFNATMPNAKDPSGNGSKKGASTYFNAYKSSSDRAIDKKILEYLKTGGMDIEKTGLNTSYGLRNAKVYQEVGVNYTLLETCYIDDNDDMVFYKKHKDQMAKQVAQAITDYFK